MKLKMPIILSAFCLTLSLSACQSQGQETTAAYIGIDAAKNAALEAAGIPSSDASFSTAGLDNRDGTFFYQICFEADGTEYEYAVDAFTGVIIEETSSKEALLSQSSAPESETTGPSSEENTSIESTAVSSPDSTVVSPSESSSSGILDEAAALDIALAHAGITESDAKRVEIKRDYEDDIAVYEIQFRADGQQKYEFKIDAATGAVVSYDYERDSRDAQAASSGSAVLSEEEIRGIVQKRVPGAPAENIFLHLDEDDGRMEYEGTLFFDGMEYEFKIDAYSGSVTEWESEQTHRRQP